MDPEVEALYGLPLDEFTPARNALARARSKAGDKESAAAVKGLRKASVVAWALNQLARQRTEDVDALLEAGARLRRAQTAALEGGDPAELRDASRAENTEVQALAAQAASILRGAGRGGTAVHEERLAATLRAAAVDPVAGDLLRRGVLAEELNPAGFGFGVGEGGVDVAVPADFRASKADSPAATHERQRAAHEKARNEAHKQEERAERQRRRALEAEVRAAQEHAHRLTREADEAEARVRKARHAAQAATTRAEELAQALENRAQE